MADMTEKIKTMNSVVRTGILLIGIAAIIFVGYMGYESYVRPAYEAQRAKQELEKTTAELEKLRLDHQKQEQQIAEQTEQINVLNVENSDLKDKIAKLEVRNKLLKLDRRLAQIKILETGTEADSGEHYMEIEFVELDKDNNPIGEKKRTRLKGELLYVDSLVVKFDDKYIEENDLLRGSTLSVFRAIWGDGDGPRGGLRLDENLRTDNKYETAYGTAEQMSDFERKIWNDFWTFSNDPEKQKEFGIRAGHGQANYIKPVENRIYRVELRASDGLSLVPITEDQEVKESSK